VAAALVGTFLGILLCYGLFRTLAGSMGKNQRRGIGVITMASVSG